jgi:putative transposase
MTNKSTKTDELLDDLLKDCEGPDDILGERGLLKGVMKQLVARALHVELT